MWEPRPLTNLRVSTACYRDSFTFIPYLSLVHNFTQHFSKINFSIILLSTNRSHRQSHLLKLSFPRIESRPTPRAVNSPVTVAVTGARSRTLAIGVGAAATTPLPTGGAARTVMRLRVNWFLINRLYIFNSFDVNWLNTNRFHINRFDIETTTSIPTRETSFAMSVRGSLQPGVSVIGLVVADYRLFRQGWHFCCSWKTEGPPS
jgi:hypothetical protein